MNPLEESAHLQVDWSKLEALAGKGLGVVPVAVQNADTREVILVVYVNQQALDESIRTKTATFWSTSRDELWVKGKTSGDTFELLEIRVNCEQNSMLYVVLPRRQNICHTQNQQGKARNCFYRRLDMATMQLVNLDP